MCDGPANCWHLTGDGIEAALAELEDHHGLTPDGGKPSPSLPVNWSAVSRADRTIFQRRDIDHYVVLGDGSEEWLLILCAQGDRAYPAPLDHRTLPVENSSGTTTGTSEQQGKTQTGWTSTNYDRQSDARRFRSRAIIRRVQLVHTGRTTPHPDLTVRWSAGDSRPRRSALSPKSGKRAGLFRGDHDRWSILQPAAKDSEDGFVR